MRHPKSVKSVGIGPAFTPSQTPELGAAEGTVTDAHRHAQWHHEARQRTADFARASGGWFWETDADHRCVWLSDNFEQCTGYPPQRVVGLPVYDRHLLDAFGQPCTPARTFIQQLDGRVEFRTLSAMGYGERTRLISLSGVPRFRPDGRFAGYRGMSRDVTDRVRLERDASEKVAAERASRSKSEFLSRVSHELRTPLNAILGFSQLMRSRGHATSPQAQEWLHMIHRSGKRLLTMVNELLDLTRIEQGQLTLSIQDFAIEDVLALALATVRADSRHDGIAVRMPPAPSRHFVQGDRGAVEQVLINLLSNAFKYNRQGGSVSVSVSEGEAVRVTIEDTGVGMSESALADLFQPFNRLGAERSDVPGSGLGLAISRALASAMGGTLVIASHVGAGTTCTFTLPCGDECRTMITEPSRLDGRGGVSDLAAASRRRVLYVEDDPVNQLLLQEVVESIPGWCAEVARTGQSGLQAATRSRPDLVLLDMNLPDANGRDVLGWMRAVPELASLPCIALSADAMPQQVAAALAAGFDDYWTKPFDVGDIRRKLIAVMGTRPGPTRSDFGR